MCGGNKKKNGSNNAAGSDAEQKKKMFAGRGFVIPVTVSGGYDWSSHQKIASHASAEQLELVTESFSTALTSA